MIKPSELPTVTESFRSGGSSHDSDVGRFRPGAVLAQRYRIVSLLGRGGMGEVYRADDLLLGQPVALKFMPDVLAGSETSLNRLRKEVRIARQVSHPNVCRIYDIGEAAGLTYLTMEYVDGEDLASLLRRIGRLPQEKALEIARKLCAGLTAAHDRGVIHRDLKPSNIMLDGKGQVRITDFGLAALAEEMRDVGGGTPAYMAPEQRAGKEATPRSDIYALGIVLHELFTGKRPSPESKKAELDPSVERVIMRCLERDPQLRPATALRVAAALPGGDPLTLALAAGETPSAEVVANAGTVEGLRVPVAVSCLAAVIVGLATLCFLRQRVDIVNQIPMESSPEVLAANAREIAKSLGYAERPVDTAFGWNYDTDYLRYVGAKKDASIRRAHLKTNRPSAIYFWYRESQNYLVVDRPFHSVTRFNPPAFELGMLDTVLDSEGRLIELNAQPPAETPDKGHAVMVEWNRLFAAAGLDPEHFATAQPILKPPVAWDVRAAWTGSWDNFLPEPLRVEAAAYEGRPVFFRLVGPWTRPNQVSDLTMGSLIINLSSAMFVLFLVVLPSWAALLAWRNARVGRGDRRGAFRLAGFVFVCVFVASQVSSHHVPTTAEFSILYTTLEGALIAGTIAWLLYMAFEPQVRKRSPVMLISWSRLLAGELRDPLVGGDLLVGIAFGTAEMCVLTTILNMPFAAKVLPQLMPNMSACLSLWFQQVIVAVFAGLSYMFLLNLSLLLVRRQWLAVSAFVFVITLVETTGYGVSSPIAVARPIFLLVLLWYVLTRFGILTAVALIYVHVVVQAFPLTINRSAWYAHVALFAIMSVLIIAAYAFHTTLAGRPLWSGRFRET